MMPSFMKMLNKPGGPKRTIHQIVPLMPEDLDDESSVTIPQSVSGQETRRSVSRPEWMSSKTFQLLMLKKEYPPGGARSSHASSPKQCPRDCFKELSEENPKGVSELSEEVPLASEVPGASRCSVSSGPLDQGPIHCQHSSKSSSEGAQANPDSWRQASREEMGKYAKEIQAMLKRSNIMPPLEDVGNKKKTAKKKDEEEVEDIENAYKRMVESMEFRLSEWQLYMEMSIERKNRIRHWLGLELL
eukprot:TRINITY_DN13192_c0_g1_i1.p1 TRINITY_DN13192_c0_g1~~TRINITY_DN13192_c0_g1_i1.p1  ORF type:complete len:245 (-),score=36.78 TRINITY_DN13192_c0_g1_i1:85-819(-)